MEVRLLATCLMLALCVKDVDGLVARLVQGMNNTATSKGRLEILHNGTWSTVCDDRFGKTEAQVACRMLGLNTVRSLAVRSSMYGKGSGTILLDDVRCQGSETDLDQCQHRGLYTHNCIHHEDVGIICSDQPEQVRLTGSQMPVPDRGRIEIQLGSEWFTVCVPDDNFPKVVCRQLGLPIKEAVVTQASSFGPSQSRQLMVHFACKGHETNILDCDQLTDSESCRRLDFGVICSDSVQLNARLVNGTSEYNGHLEVSHNGIYIPVLPGLFSNLAIVVCRTLGFNRPKVVQLMVIGCAGTETSLTQCNSFWAKNYHEEDSSVGVICSNHRERLRLTGTSRTRHDMGRVEIQLDNEWYSLSVDEEVIAKLVCRILNLPWKKAVQLWDSPGPMARPRLLTKYYCTGEEVNILDCLQFTSITSYYLDSDFFGVFCSNSSSLLIHPGGMRYPFMEGTNVTLKCGNKHLTLYNVTWPENARGVPIGSKLMIDKLARTHNGSLVKCEAMSKTDSLQSTRLSSDIVELQVYYKPSIWIASNLTTCSPQPPLLVCVVTDNTSVTIVCHADSNPPPANISWSGPVSSGTQDLHLTPANSSSHEGFYTCSVFTQSVDEDERLPLSSSYTFTLVIQDRPAVLSFQLNGVDNESVTVLENSIVNMSCLASGRPNITIIKELNRLEIRRQSQEDIKFIEGKQSELNYSMKNVECQQSGDYRCEVNNELGNDSQTVRLIVQCAPKIEEDQLPRVYIRENKGNLSIKMTSYPTPYVTSVTYTKVYGKARPHNSLINNKLHVTCMSMPVSPASVTCNLSVANVTPAEKGLYTMVFSNSLGNTNFNFLLLFEGVDTSLENNLMMSHAPDTVTNAKILYTNALHVCYITEYTVFMPYTNLHYFQPSLLPFRVLVNLYKRHIPSSFCT